MTTNYANKNSFPDVSHLFTYEDCEYFGDLYCTFEKCVLLMDLQTPTGVVILKKKTKFQSIEMENGCLAFIQESKDGKETIWKFNMHCFLTFDGQAEKKAESNSEQSDDEEESEQEENPSPKKKQKKSGDLSKSKGSDSEEEPKTDPDNHGL
jgi:hypothetical protein